MSCIVPQSERFGKAAGEFLCYDRIQDDVSNPVHPAYSKKAE